MRAAPDSFRSKTLRKAIAIVVSGLLTLTSTSAQSNKDSDKIAKKLKKIDHIIVVYQENWSFDSLYGYFPGANGSPMRFPGSHRSALREFR